MSRVHKILNSALKGPILECLVGKKLRPTKFRELWLDLGDGHRVYAHLHWPAGSSSSPGVVMVPGALSCGTDYDRGGEVTPEDLAALGFVVLHYDPAGRGRSEGDEDYWGAKQQKELADVLRYFSEMDEVSSANLGILSFSIGITIAAGALANHELPFVKYLFDWEGPSNKFIITKNDTHPPLLKFPTSDLTFWQEREPVSFIADISCGYFRYQAFSDHMQGKFKGHAIELVNMATRGKAAWTRLNNNPLHTVFDINMVDDYNWVSCYNNHKGQLLKFLLEVRDQECV